MAVSSNVSCARHFPLVNAFTLTVSSNLIESIKTQINLEAARNCTLSLTFIIFFFRRYTENLHSPVVRVEKIYKMLTPVPRRIVKTIYVALPIERADPYK